MPKQPYINSFEDPSLRKKTIRELRNTAPAAAPVKPVKTSATRIDGNTVTARAEQNSELQGLTNTNPSAYVGGDKIYETADGKLVVETSKDVYITNVEEVTEQKYISNATGGQVNVGTTVDFTYTNSVTNANRLGFDTDSGFTVTDLGAGLAKIGLQGIQGYPGGINGELQYNCNGSFAGFPNGSPGQALVINGGGNISWGEVATPPGGSTNQVQYNNGSGGFGANAGFTYCSATCAVGMNLVKPPVDTSFTVHTSNSGTNSWYTRYGDFGINTQDDYGSGIQYDSTGNIYMVGADGNTGIPHLVKFDKAGNVVWQKIFTDPNNYYKTGDAVTVDDQDNVYCTIGTDDAAELFTIFKFNSAGTLIWSVDVGTAEYVTTSPDIAVDSNGNVYVATRFYDGAAYDPVILKFDSTGSLLWQRAINTDTINSWKLPSAIECDASGNSYTVIRVRPLTATVDTTLLVKFDPSGNLLWQKEFDSGYGFYAGVIKIDALSNVYIAGEYNLPGVDDTYVIKLDSSGNFIWQTNINSGSWESATGIDLDTLGNIYVHSYQTVQGAGGADYYIAKLDSSGSLIWARTFGGSYNDWTWYYWGFKTLRVFGTSYATTGYTYSGSTGDAEAIVTQFPTDGSLTGTYGDFTYAVATATTNNTPVTIISSVYTVYTPTLSIDPATVTPAPGSNTNTRYLINSPDNLYVFNPDGSLDLPNYSLPAAPASTTGQALVYCGSGVAGWAEMKVNLDINNSFVVGNGLSCNTGSGNIALGYGALYNNTYSWNNIGIGACALNCTTIGYQNVAVGYGALQKNIIGIRNVGIGSCAGNNLQTGCSNIAIGSGALFLNTGGSYNISIGESSLYWSESATCNFAAGVGALYRNYTGHDNIAIGRSALSCTTLSDNIALGYGALSASVEGCNIAIGLNAMATSCTGSSSVAIGTNAGRYMLGGYNNVAIGNNALTCSCSNFSTAIGSEALQSNICGPNIAIGHRALAFGSTGVYNIAIGQCSMNYGNGTFNIAIGTLAGSGLCSGQCNTIIGSLAGTPNMTRTVLIGADSCERIKVDSTGLYINGACWPAGGSVAAATPTVRGVVYGLTTCGLAGNSFFGSCAGNVGVTGCANTALGWKALASVTCGANNAGIGRCALSMNSFGGDNVAVGALALRCNLGGCYNIALGYGALQYNTYGILNVAIGRNALSQTTACNNIGIGECALSNNCTGTFNIAMGQAAALSNTTGVYNIAIGGSALRSNNTGIGNVAVGVNSLYNARESNNIAVGYRALNNLCWGTGNVALGNDALFCAGTGANNIAIGSCSLFLTNIGGSNVAIGNCALYANVNGCNNIAIGCLALKSTGSASNNFAAGYCALYSNCTGANSIAIGECALTLNTTGANNIALGSLSLACSTIGNCNIALGNSALYCNAAGCDNIAIGATALKCACFGTANIAIGTASQFLNLGAGWNISMGCCALYSNAVGSCNTAFGRLAGSSLVCGCNNVFLGDCAQPATTTSCNTITLGNFSVDCIRAQVTAISSLSDARDKTDIVEIPLGLDFILNLRPVKFTWNMRDGARVGVQDSGFIAQEVATLEENNGAVEWLDMVGRENPDKLEVKPAKLIPILVKAVQELAERHGVRLQALEDAVNKLKAN